MENSGIYIKKNEVIVKRKPVTGVRPGQDPKEGKWKIGASLRNQDVLRGITYEEETKYLPNIISVSPTSHDWNKKTREYWLNISKHVPEDGLHLEAGMTYHDVLNADGEVITKAKDLADSDPDFLKGVPLNVSDYILWRYCLLYSEVANEVKLAGKSPRIRFYLHSKAEDIRIQTETKNTRKKAYARYIEVSSDIPMLEAILRMFASKSAEMIIPDDEEEMDIMAESFAKDFPKKFLEYANDTQLKMKSMIERCIEHGHLRRIENTDTIMYGDNQVIGNNMNEAVGFLKQDRNSRILNALKAQLQYLGEARQDIPNSSTGEGEGEGEGDGINLDNVVGEGEGESSENNNQEE